MRLWTIQDKKAWQRFQKLGVLEADSTKMIGDFSFAYQWMMQQMQKRLPNYSGKYPIWAWNRPKPDLRMSGHLPHGSQGIRIEFCVPSERVLLSDFLTWHAVLNVWYLDLSKENKKWDKKIHKYKVKYNIKSPQDLPSLFKKKMLASWERIFDLKLLKNHREWTDCKSIQAVLEQIFLDEVVKVTKFKAR